MGYLISYKAIRSLISQFDAEKLGFLMLNVVNSHFSDTT